MRIFFFIDLLLNVNYFILLALLSDLYWLLFAALAYINSTHPSNQTFSFFTRFFPLYIKLQWVNPETMSLDFLMQNCSMQTIIRNRLMKCNTLSNAQDFGNTRYQWMNILSQRPLFWRIKSSKMMQNSSLKINTQIRLLL